MSSQIIPLKAGEDSRVRAEFRPGRPLAFELQRRGYAARGWVLPGSSASVLHGRWPSCGVAEKARIGRDLFRSEDDPPAAKPATPLLSLRWTFRAKRACVVITDAEPDRLAPLTPPAPMGLRGVWVVAVRCCALRRAVAPTLLRGVLHVQAQTCAHHQGAVCIQDPLEGGRQRSAQGASEFEAGAGAGTAVRTERRHHRHRHALHRLATAHGARLPGRRGAQEARAQAGVGEDGRRARVSDCCRQGFRRCHEGAECVAMRGHSTNPAAIEAEIAHLRSLALDALRRHWRVIFGRTPPADLSKDLLGRMVAYRLQERAFGGLDRESLRFLDGLARQGGSPRRRLKPGTVLVRDYQGQRHTVTVVSDGFDWQGATYPSLSAIARAITGTAWSGPRFFALARGNGAPARRNTNASAREGRDGSQPARGMNASEMNTASLPLQTASHATT